MTEKWHSRNGWRAAEWLATWFRWLERKGRLGGIEIRRAPFLGTKGTRRRKGGQGGAKVVLGGRQENGQRLGKCKTTGGSS